MQIDLKYLRRHYAALSDDGLLEIDETELVDDARRIYEEELAARGLRRSEGEDGEELAVETNRPGQGVRRAAGEIADESSDLDGEAEPDWLGDAACPATFVVRAGGEAAQDAAEARNALEAAGIPCYVASGKVVDEDTSWVQPEHEFRVMVPSKWNLEAESILDREIFNREVEAKWRTHFQMLTDEELRALDPEALFGGLKDRIERVTRAYHEELAQRD